MSEFTLPRRTQQNPDGLIGVSPGYMRTEVGVIPNDWVAETLGPFVKLTSGDSPSKLIFMASGVPYFKVEQLNHSNKYLGRDDTEYFVSCSKPVSRHSLIFPKRGASIMLNKIRILDVDAFMDTNLMTITILDELRLVSEYLYYAILYIELWRIADTTSIPQINNKHINPLRVPIPSDRDEQRTIAAALADVDELIGAIDKLIVKKRAIKQAAMDELLTGHTRLPGFNEEWKHYSLAQLGRFSKGRGIRRDEVADEGIGCIRYGEIYTRYNDYVVDLVSFIRPHVSAKSLPINKGDLLFAGSGETAEEIGKCVAYLGESEAYAGGDIIVWSHHDQNPLFLGHLMNHETVVKQKARLGQGDAVVHISTQSLLQVEINLPLPDEQKAIADALYDMDVEIATLERRLEKTEGIKRGMMQELLTGRTRLFESS